MATQKCVQSDWNETSTVSPAYIQNKPNAAIWTVTTEDPGEGQPLAEGHYIAVVEADSTEE